MSIRLAAGLSRLFHPLLSALYLVVALGALAASSPLAGLGWVVLVLGLAVGLPALDLFRRVRSGTVSDFEVVMREQRTGPLLVGLAATLLALVLVAALQGPRPLLAALLAGLLCGLILTAVTLFWKISFHAAVPAAAAVLLAVFAGGALLWPALVLVVGLGWARVRLGRHTIAQVLAGAVVGFGGALTVVLALV
jgi:membrane-associated phospholipid phosphatase